MDFKNININNKFDRIQSVFNKLIISYSIVVVIVTVIMGFVSFLFFASCYNREIEKVHQNLLEQVTAALSFRVIQPTTQSFLDLSADYSEPAANLLHFDEPIQGNNLKIYQTSEYLKQMVAVYSGVFSAIHIYYKKQNLYISSSLGIGFFNQNSYKTPDWIHRVANNNSSDRLVWLEPRKSYFHSAQGKPNFLNRANVFTFIRTFPINSTTTDCQGLLAIDVSETTISDLIQDTIPSQYQNTFIINSQGRVISHPRKKLLFRMLNHESYIQKIINSPLSYDSFISKVNQQRSMITFTSLPNAEWKIVNVLPISEFYQSTRFIQLLLIVICLLAILVGLILSFGFTRQIYNPLETIIKKVRLLAGGTNAPLPENEYGVINRFIDEVTEKFQSFRETEPVLKNNFIMGLLYDRFFSEQELADKSKLLDESMQFPHYYVVLFHVDADAIKNLTLEENQIIKYHLNLKIQENNDAQIKCLAIELPDSQIGVIVGMLENDNLLLNQLIERIITYAATNYQLPVTGTVGTEVDSWLEIHQSFKTATLLQKYHYFFPQISIIQGDTFLKKEHSSETIPDSFITDFSEELRCRNSNQIEQTFSRLSTTIATENYSATHCQQVIVEIAHAFSIYLKDMRYPLSKTEQKDLMDLFSATGNIETFFTWIREFAEKVFDWTEKRVVNRNNQIVEQVMHYLSQHLEKDISLDSAAEMVNLSPSYFSKIFKEVIGVAFSTYLTDLRITKAQELLVETDLSIQEIGFKVGYNAPAYFIKQFKAKCGYTPSDYRRQFHNRALL